MRTLVYVPIIHTSADLGSLAQDVIKRGIADFGEEFWAAHEKTVLGFWDAVKEYFDSIEVPGFKIYQDGMVADGEIGEQIVEAGIKLGSKNYELVKDLIRRGAMLVKTEDFRLVKEERDRLLAITQAKSVKRKLIAFIRYKMLKPKLLKLRDRCIGKKIDETLEENETGIILVGAYHNVRENLPKDIHVIEIKDANRLREYQRLLPFHRRNAERFKELGEYLESRIESHRELAPGSKRLC